MTDWSLLSHVLTTYFSSFKIVVGKGLLLELLLHLVIPTLRLEIQTILTNNHNSNEDLINLI